MNYTRIITRGNGLFGLSDILGDIELYTYLESANFSPSNDAGFIKIGALFWRFKQYYFRVVSKVAMY